MASHTEDTGTYGVVASRIIITNGTILGLISQVIRCLNIYVSRTASLKATLILPKSDTTCCFTLRRTIS